MKAIEGLREVPNIVSEWAQELARKMGKHLFDPNSIDYRMREMRACDVDAPSVPLGFGEFRQHPVVLVIAVDEACRPRLGLEPVEPVAVGVRAVPHESEVAGDHHHVVARERPAVRPALGGEAAGAVFGPSMHVARYGP